MSGAASRGWLRSVLGIARSGAGAAIIHPLRSGVTVAAVVAIVLPYVVGIGISYGLKEEIAEAVRQGPDLSVTATRFGRVVPLPAAAADRIRGIPGVRDVVPRIVGEVRIGVEGWSVVVVGLPVDRLPEGIECVSGRLPAAGAPGEIVVGSELAEHLGTGVGDALLPFYRNNAGERVSRVVGVFRSDAPLWQSHVMLVSLETARTIFAERDAVTELLVRCPETLREPVADQIRRMESLASDPGAVPLRPRVTVKDDVEVLLLRRVLDRETLLQLPFVLAFAVGVPLVMVTSGAGLVERRREAGLLRAMGWSQDALLFRSLVESSLLSLIGASLAVILAYLWLEVFGGAGLAAVLIPGADRVPGFRVPFHLGAVPVLLGYCLCVVLVSAGTLHSTWRASTAPAAEAMR